MHISSFDFNGMCWSLSLLISNICSLIVQYHICILVLVLLDPLSPHVSYTCSREVNTLMDLINAQQEMAVWQFLPAIVSLQSAHSKLSSWNSIVPLGNQV